MGAIEAVIGTIVAIGDRKPRRVQRPPADQLEDAYDVLSRIDREAKERHRARVYREPVPTLSENTIYEYPDQPNAALPIIVV